MQHSHQALGVPFSRAMSLQAGLAGASQAVCLYQSFDIVPGQSTQLGVNRSVDCTFKARGTRKEARHAERVVDRRKWFFNPVLISAWKANKPQRNLYEKNRR
jgi:ribosome modulation factor